MFLFPNTLLALFMSALSLMMMLFTMETPDYQRLAVTIEELSATKQILNSTAASELSRYYEASDFEKLKKNKTTEGFGIVHDKNVVDNNYLLRYNP